MSDCLFCKIVQGEIPSHEVYSDDAAYAFLDVSPVKPGHTLVVPRTHVADALEDPEVLASIAPAISATARVLRDRLGADGFNLLSNVGEVAGQSVQHLHVHVIPRTADAPGMANLLTKDDSLAIDDIVARLRP
ncbi:HIT family protein [Nigerium massiliense]|uniref:HIT family protein n=1 Tax=Nigerium massiliense TaxID=1522317 RepID=UPI000591657F|nr:HIT family protein [Nigerium massiliense]